MNLPKSMICPLLSQIRRSKGIGTIRSSIMYISVARKSQRDDLQEKGTFRLCALGAIDKADIEAFFRVLKEALAELGMILPKE